MIEKQKPINKRWPGQYAFRLTCYLPSGGQIELETTLPPEQAKRVLDEFLESIGKKGSPK